MIEVEASSVRSTSIAAFKRICESGVLSKIRLQTYQYLYEFGPCTSSELYYRTRNNRRPSNQANVTTRLGELRDMGCVSEVEKRKCSITGETVIVWAVNGQFPVKLEKKETNKQKAARLHQLLNWIIKCHPELKEEIINKNEQLKHFQK